jgi:hypothetical protein
MSKVLYNNYKKSLIIMILDGNVQKMGIKLYFIPILYCFYIRLSFF